MTLVNTGQILFNIWIINWIVSWYIVFVYVYFIAPLIVQQITKVIKE